MDGSPSDSCVHGISQARILEQTAVFLFKRSSQSRDQARVSCVAGGFFTAEPPGSVQFRPVAQSCLTLCDAMNRSTPGLPVHHQLPELTQTHAH